MAVLIALLGASCAKSRSDDPGLAKEVRISPLQTIRTDLVGHSEWERRATFVMVDADNLSTGELHVTLAGTLVDAGGRKVGALRPESLRIPPGGKRTFVLVDDQDSERPDAATAKIEVRGASPPRWEPSVRIEDGHIFNDHGKVMVAADVTNEADRPGKVLVFAGFHDADGKPLQRQHVVLPLGPEVTQTVRFVGPEGAKTGYLFLGDSSY